MPTFDKTHPALNTALIKRGYESLTPVQNAVLDPALSGQDMLVSAQTGSGKTVAFGLACAETLLGKEKRFERKSKPLALVIAPTRELALQVQRELEWLYAESGASVISCVGGMDARTERRALEKGAHIVVGTPGRLRDHIERGAFDTSALRAVVLDEADEMLDMGFRDELEYILETTPENRRTLLFSATVPKAIAKLAERYQSNAMRVTTKEEQKQHVDIEYQALSIAPNDRENAIVNVLRYHEAQNAIIFCGTRTAVNLMKSRLTNRGFSVVAISGELSQAERSNALQSLRDGRANVCVATDVAARGIDLPGLGLVIHADLPQNKDTMLHRSGRTGRAGSKGISALMVPHNWRSRAERLLKNAKIDAKWIKPPSIEDITRRDQERFLAHPALVEPPRADEKEAAANLLESYGAEQIATALLRMHNSQKPAPEELLDFVPSKHEKQKKSRDEFNGGAWISLSVGRNEDATPRWIVPLLCGKGHLKGDDIGAIRIQERVTYIELSAECTQKFFKHVADGSTLEKNIIVSRLDEPPELQKGGRIDRSNRPNRKGDKKPYGDKKKPYGDKKPHGKKPWDDKPKDGEGFKKKKHKGNRDNAPWADKPKGDKPKSDKPPYQGKPKSAKHHSDKPKGERFKKDGAPLGKKKPKTFKGKKKG
ncbi:MAG: DEAD/DEAH box helicase [Micavibrio sp.]|nr:DEAD/DEAH box helicase [Micavibrio sp.]